MELVSQNHWLELAILGLFILGAVLTLFGKNRRWKTWKLSFGYAMLAVVGLWAVAALATSVFGLGRGRPIFTYNLLDLERFRWRGPSLSAGKHTIVFDFKYDGPGPGKGGTGVLMVDGKEVDRKTMPHSIPVIVTMDETFDVGVDTRTPVDFSYDVPFRFNGTIDKLTFKLGPSQMTAEEQQKAAEFLARAAD